MRRPLSDGAVRSGLSPAPSLRVHQKRDLKSAFGKTVNFPSSVASRTSAGLERSSARDPVSYFGGQQIRQLPTKTLSKVAGEKWFGSSPSDTTVLLASPCVVK